MDFIPFALPSIGDEEINEVIHTLRSNWITTGPKTKLFEKQFAEFIGVEYAIATNSGTAAMHLALESIGIKKDDCVITTPFTFTATAETIRYLGADPLFVDIDPKTFNIDPQHIRNLLESSKIDVSKVKAILPVHFAGQACDMDSILSLATDYDLKVIEDAAHALPTTYEGNFIGSMGDLTCFSFYATKTITTGEGGMVVTQNERYAERIKTMRLHGINRDVFNRYQSDQADWYYEVIAPGFKYNLPDIAAAIGIHQLKKANKFRKQREKIARQYNDAFQDLDEIEIPYIKNPQDLHSWHLYVIKIKLDLIKIERSQFIEELKNLGIGTSVHFIPLHMQPYYKNRYKFKDTDFPNSFITYKQIISLPIYPKMSDSDVKRVCEAIKTIVSNHKKSKMI